MEKIEIKVLNNVKDDAIRNYQLFEWKLIEEKNDLRETTLIFERDNSTPYYQKLVKLENQFNNVYKIPSWVSYSLIVVTLIYVTVIMILWLTHVLQMQKSYVVLLLILPSGFLLLINLLINYIRSKEMQNHINSKENKYKIYEEKIKKIKE